MSNRGFGFGALLLVILLGLGVGIGLGLLVAWGVWPAQVTEIDIVDLKSSSQDDYIVLTASAYAYDQDLPRARERLNLLRASKLNDRLGELARTLSVDGKAEASYVAALALALGSPDKDLAQIAATPSPTFTSTPFPTAVSTRLVATITPVSTLAATFSPTPTSPRTLTPTRRYTPTRTPLPVKSPTAVPPTAVPKTATPPRPTATTAPVAAPIGPEWVPPRSGWPGGVNFTAASVSPGQKYWRLVKAQYCDYQDDRNGCPSMAGGPEQAGTWVMIADENGARTDAPLFIGTTQSTDVKSAQDMCACNYTFPVTNSPIYVGGLPSDTLGGMGLVSLKLGFSDKAHVRYFLWFQMVTR